MTHYNPLDYKFCSNLQDYKKITLASDSRCISTVTLPAFNTDEGSVAGGYVSGNGTVVLTSVDPPTLVVFKPKLKEKNLKMELQRVSSQNYASQLQNASSVLGDAGRGKEMSNSNLQ
jgi:hypothetical protein